MKGKIRITMADDHPIVRQGLRQMIETDKSINIIAEAGDGLTALNQIETLRPDVAVLDIDMPAMDGFAVAKALRANRVQVEMIFLTIHREEEMFKAAIDLEVKGYVLKDSAVTDIISSIKSVAEGRPFISPSLSSYLLKRSSRTADLAQKKPGIDNLTSMERRILKMIAEEKTSKEIAEHLFISYRTVETHRTNISKKLELHGSLALIRFAVAHKSEL